MRFLRCVFVWDTKERTSSPWHSRQTSFKRFWRRKRVFRNEYLIDIWCVTCNGVIFVLLIDIPVFITLYIKSFISFMYSSYQHVETASPQRFRPCPSRVVLGKGATSFQSGHCADTPTAPWRAEDAEHSPLDIGNLADHHFWTAAGVCVHVRITVTVSDSDFDGVLICPECVVCLWTLKTVQGFKTRRNNHLLSDRKLNTFL